MLSARAYTWTEGATVAAGEYYLYNIDSERFMTQGCWWGTHMAADGAGKVITISGSADAYNLHMAGVAAGSYLSGGAYTDTGGETTDANLQWTFEAVSVTGYTNAYKIKNNSTETYLRSYTADTNTGHKVEVETLADDNSFYWLLIPKATRETLTGATSANPKDATHLVTNPDGEWYIRYESEAWKEYTHGGWTGTFSHNSSNQAGYVSSFYEIWVGTWVTSNGTQVGNNWHLNDFDEHNTIASLPNGKYRLTMTVEATQQTDPEEITGAYLYANTTETAVSTRADYNADCIVTTGTLTAGVKTVSTTANWVSFDNLRLTYYGNAVEVYNPTAFSSGGAATAETWYAFTVPSAGIYKVASDGNPTIYYTQDDSDDADETASATLKGSASNYYTFVRLTAGTLYFKVDATNAISITEGYSVDDDLTSLLANPDFSSSDLSGWTIKTTDGCSAPAVDVTNTDCEFYEKKFDMSQTLTGMKKGTYEVSFQAFQRLGVVGTLNTQCENYMTDNWTSLATLKTSAERSAVANIFRPKRTTAIVTDQGDWGNDHTGTYNEETYYVPNTMYAARQWFNTDSITGVKYYTTVARAICTEDNGSMYFGFEGDLTGTTGAWLIFANFKLKYIDTDVLVDPTASETLIAEATTLAARVMNSDVRDDLQDAIDALTAEKTSGDLYAALEAEMVTATASADNYALLATAISNAESYVDYEPQFSGSMTAYTAAITTAQGVYDAGAVTDCTAAITALTDAIHAANVSDYTTFTGYTYSYATLLDTDMRNWTTNDWAVMTGNEHWNGNSGQSYYEQSGAEWGSSTTWSHSGTETVVLPAGDYVMSIIARANANVTSTMTVTVGENTPISTTLTHKGSVGRGVNTSGVATYADGQTYANSNSGYGWEYRFLPFTVSEENTEVTITVSATSQDGINHQWVSLTNPLLKGTVHPNQVIVNQIASLKSTLEGLESSITPALYATFSDDIDDADAATAADETSTLEAIVGALTADIATASAQAAINTAISNNKGDITSLLGDGSTFETSAGAWTGGNRVTGMARSWRSATVNNVCYERTADGDMTLTLAGMPAGTYKVVAAARAAAGCVITPKIADGSGTSLTGVGDTRTDDSDTEINLNGVEMPYSSLGGFTTNPNGHNWKWISATGTLAADGDLVITFSCDASGKTGDDSWMPIDDVHLYCTSASYNSIAYTMTLDNITGNRVVTNTGNNIVVTCDIKTSNPNAMLRSSGGGNITTAAGVAMNNLIYKSSSTLYTDKMVLYDGYDFNISDYEDDTYRITNATLYRNFAADTWATLVIPFWPTTTLDKRVPTSLSENTLSFATVANTDSCYNDKPLLVKSASAISAITGVRGGTGAGGSGIAKGKMISGKEETTMKGVYTTGKVPASTSTAYRYVVGTADNTMHYVSGGNVNIKPFRAYFELDNSTGGDPAARRSIIMNFDDDATGINSLNELIEQADLKAMKDGKYMENGRIVVVKNGVKYNTNGQIIK